MSALILVVEDDAMNREVMEATLNLEGFDVSFAINGKQALNKASAQQPQLILLDINLPDMSGFEVCRTLKSQSEMQHIPIICISGLDDESSRQEALSSGADAFLSRNIVGKDFIRQIKLFLDN